METIKYLSLGMIVGFLFQVVAILGSIDEKLSDIRTIESEARDTLNVSNCWQMNDSAEAFEACLKDY